MKIFPGRVYSKPEFTALPPYIFSGAEFALIPSRDEPFGLVAVEFGRKGALGVGARVGGLGQVRRGVFSFEPQRPFRFQFAPLFTALSLRFALSFYVYFMSLFTSATAYDSILGHLCFNKFLSTIHACFTKFIYLLYESL